MKKILPFFLLTFAVASFTFAQTVVFSDNFDSYTVGSHLAQSNLAWTTWSGEIGGASDGVISNTHAASAPNSLYITESNDQVYKFNDLTSGHYVITFNYYVPSSGNGAYFNVMHSLNANWLQWAFACYFNVNGTGYLTVADSNYNFAYPSNAWFPIEIDMDITKNVASLTVNNAFVLEWPFHYCETHTGMAGTHRLAGVDFYAGSPGQELYGTYYVDDFTVVSKTSEFVVAPAALNTWFAPNSSTTLDFTLANPGDDFTDYKIITTYDITNPNSTSTGGTVLAYFSDSLWNDGYTTAASYDLAVGFPSSMLQSHIGQTLQRIDVATSSEVTSAKIRVYDMDHPFCFDVMSTTGGGPGVVIYEQEFVPVNGWNSVTLNNPIVIDGRDLWVGVWIEQPADVKAIYMDYNLDGNPYSHWIKNSFANIWNTRALPGCNLAIAAYVDGTPITPWLTVEQADGIVNAGGNMNPGVTINTSGMQIGESYSAKLHCYSDALSNLLQVVPVNLNVSGISVNEHNQIEVSVYPNPVTDHLQIVSDEIQRVEVYNLMGQCVFSQSYGDTHVIIPTDGMAPGTYAVTVTTRNDRVTKKVVIR